MNVPLREPPVVHTTCPYCGVGCGLLAKPDGFGRVEIAGDPAHPANFGRLCSKGAALGETVGLEGRLLYPMLRQADGTLARAEWRAALDAVADGLNRIIVRHGPDAVAFYLSGQLLTEDYYVANKLMKGFIGSANVDTNSRLCMASSVAGHRRAFGADIVPSVYADLDLADLIILVGSNTAWCHPVLFQRIVENRSTRGARLITIDPRRTETSEEADLFLPIAPGTDTALFCGLLVHLVESGAVDRRYVAAHTSDFAAALARAREIAPTVAATAEATELHQADVVRFFELFRTHERVVTCYSQGVNQSAQGTDKVNAIINCHLATGRIGRSGMGPLSLTGQPNAMGGREVGGLANQLAAHMGFAPEEVDRVGRFWNAPRMARREGLKAVQMFEAVSRGEVKALWVMATNPVVSLPRAAAVREAIGKLELFIVSENVVSNDSVNAGARVLLPAAAWGEKDGTVTNSERCISRQRAFLPLPGEAKPDWWIVTEVARRMGFAEAFPYRSPADIFSEHAALSGYENEGTRDFDISAFANISDAEYDTLSPVQWPVRALADHKEASGTCGKRFFSDGGFFTPDRRARFVAPQLPRLREPTSAEFPLRLNTGRIRDQWHTMTRTGRSPRLAAHRPEPFVEIHPADAEAAGLSDGDFARVTTAHGTCVLKAVISDAQRRGSVFVPIHWSAETASSARVGDLVASHTDPISGQPEAKATPARIEKVGFAFRGFARTRSPLAVPVGTWWVRVAAAEGVETLFATNHGPLVWHDLAHRLLGGDAYLSERLDPTSGSYHAVAFVDGQAVACLALARGKAPSLDGIAALIAAGAPDGGERPPIPRIGDHGLLDREPVVCACFGVGLNAIRAAVAAGAGTVAEIGRIARAGTNCGSCVPELKRIIARERVAYAG